MITVASSRVAMSQAALAGTARRGLLRNSIHVATATYSGERDQSGPRVRAEPYDASRYIQPCLRKPVDPAAARAAAGGRPDAVADPLRRL